MCRTFAAVLRLIVCPFTRSASETACAGAQSYRQAIDSTGRPAEAAVEVGRGE